MEKTEFRPPVLLRSPHLQSILASSKARGRLIRLRANGVLRNARSVVLDCGEGVRLQGAYSAPADEQACAGLVILLHGWEGSIGSTYVLSAARSLWARGYAIFRLNFRDHGGTHGLNPGLFHSCRLREVVGAVAEAQRTLPHRPVSLVGFSLGANFALRVALQATRQGIALDRVVAVSPVIDPASGLRAIEAAPWFYERTFVSKVRRSLARKQSCFPDLYDLRECRGLSSVREMTRWLIDRTDEFDCLDDYLRGYSVAGRRLADLQVPTTIVTAADDPIIPVEDLRDCARPPKLEIDIQRRGGHCGFIESLTLRSWIDRRIARILAAAPR